ncbi:caspase family protein [Micromonospora endolithica]|uniref:caspase family protein n=1 Tax=Micromonospora endolithica TaxID=230091 RepID=UPI001EDF1487|nr:caspase family protein [Micromonospora endolithica]
MTGARQRRRALLLGCDSFTDPSLAQLRSPCRDVEELTRVLRSRDTCGYTVTAEVNADSRQAQRAIEGFFSSARITDGMNLLYLSCHGVQDNRGRLYFAFTDTERDYLSSTAVSADWVRERINASRSKATLVLVDCCFSGAFIKGMQARSAGAVSVESLVQDLPRGSGVAVLTASGETEVSFEDAESAEIRPSYFTDAVIAGLATGAADLNRDGQVTVDELYEYVYEQVVSGPSPQRPRRLGMGEGTLVVSNAVQTPASPSTPVIAALPKPARTHPRIADPVLVRGVLGWVSFDGDWIVIGKDGVGNIYKGERRYHVSQLAGIAAKDATRFHHGYFQVVPLGVTPAPVSRFGPHAGRPPMTDDNSVSFSWRVNDAMRSLRHAVQLAVSNVHSGTTIPACTEAASAPHPPPAPGPRTTDARTNTSTTPTVSPAVAARGFQPLPDSHGGVISFVGRLTRQGGSHHEQAATTDIEYHRGKRDASRWVIRLPLHALDTLVSNQFDVVRWLVPWRHQWGRASETPGPVGTPVPSWLVDLAQHLGGHAAPAGSTNSTFIPTPAYLAGFCAGLRGTWVDAVSAQLVPADRVSMAAWLAQPPAKLDLPMPIHEATLHDLENARRRARRAARIRWTLRGLMWASATLLLIMEIAAIAITADGGWTGADGKPTANQTPSAVIANVGCTIPLIALVVIIIVDVRRMRRAQTASATTDPAVTVTNIDQPRTEQQP